MKLGAISDGELVARLKLLVAQERGLTVAVLAHMGEVEERRLFLPAACPSMHVYCVRVLGMSEDAAYKRTRAARVVRRLPVVGEALSDGRLHVSGVVLLAAHVNAENVDALVAEASGKTSAEIQVMVARLAPRPERPARVERKAEQVAMGGGLAPGPVRDQERARVEPLAPERFEVQMTIGAETRGKLERAQALLRHQVPGGEVAEVFDRALDALLDKIEKRKFGAAKAARAVREHVAPRTVPRSVRRAVVARDGERCAFVGEDGRRCEERGFLELDHVVPVARGGTAADGVRLLCRSHNRYEAERLLGTQTIERGRARSELDRDVLSGLRGLGVTVADAKTALAASAGDTLEERLRSALRALHSIYARRRMGHGAGENRTSTQ